MLRSSGLLHKDANHGPETDDKPPFSSVSYQSISHQFVNRRFRAVLRQHRDTGFASSWKQALLEPSNPLKPAGRPPLKLPLLYALWIAGLALGGFLWFTVFR